MKSWIMEGFTHSFCILCCLDKIKDQVIAKIAMQASDLYADALSNMQVGSVKTMWDKVSVVFIARCGHQIHGQLNNKI